MPRFKDLKDTTAGKALESHFYDVKQSKKVINYYGIDDFLNTGTVG